MPKNKRLKTAKGSNVLMARLKPDQTIEEAAAEMMVGALVANAATAYPPNAPCPGSVFAAALLRATRASHGDVGLVNRAIGSAAPWNLVVPGPRGQITGYAGDASADVT